MQIFTPLDCFPQWFLTHSLFTPSRMFHSTQCDIKGFIITIQSNSIRTEVASTWRRRKLMTVQRVGYCWRALSSEMVATTAAIPMALFQLRDSFMCWMVSDILTLLFIHVVTCHSNSMEFNAIFFPPFSKKANIRQQSIRAALHSHVTHTASYLAQLSFSCFIIVGRWKLSTSSHD